VSWTRTGTRPETREFGDWDAAISFYEDVLADPHTVLAKVIEVTAKEVRCFEHEQQSNDRRFVRGLKHNHRASNNTV
jgi:hypothetical protein